MKKLFVLLLLMISIRIPASADFLYTVTPTPAPEALAGLTLRPSDEEVKVYASPNPKANIVGYIIVNGRQEVSVLRRQGEWYYVSFTSIHGTGNGWIPAGCFLSTTPEPTAAPSPTPSAGTAAFVCNPQAGYRLNLRTSPSASAASLGKYYTGTPVTLLGESSGGYQRVMIGTVTGWMDARYLTTDAYGFVSELPEVYVVHPGGGLNLRSGPGTNTRKIGWYPDGSVLTVLGVRQDEWYHVAVGGQTGYMSSTLMSQTFPWQYGVDSDNIGIGESAVTGTALYVAGSRTNGLHLRSGASASADSLGVFYPGCPLQVVSYTRTGWAYVTVGALQGYMDIGSLTTQKPSATGRTRLISNPNGTGLNLRTQPDTSSRVIRLCGNYTRVQVLGDLTNGWCYVVAGTDTGYMMGTHLIK